VLGRIELAEDVEALAVRGVGATGASEGESDGVVAAITPKPTIIRQFTNFN